MDEVKVEPMELEDPLGSNADPYNFDTYFSLQPPVVAVLEETDTSGAGLKVQPQPEQVQSSSFRILSNPSEVNKKIDILEKGIPPKSRSNIVSKIFLGNLMSIPSTERKCCVCHQMDKRSAIPQTAKMHFWLAEKIWVPIRNRCCGHHLEVENGRKIFTKDAVKTLRERRKMGVTLNGQEAGKWIHCLTDQINDGEKWWRQFAKKSGF